MLYTVSKAAVIVLTPQTARPCGKLITRNKSIISTLDHNGSAISDDQEKAKILNSFFANHNYFRLFNFNNFPLYNICFSQDHVNISVI